MVGDCEEELFDQRRIVLSVPDDAKVRSIFDQVTDHILSVCPINVYNT